MKKQAQKSTKSTKRKVQPSKSAKSVKTYNRMPKGWKEDKGAVNPRGAKWINNGESRFAKDQNGNRKFKQALLVTDKQLFNERKNIQTASKSCRNSSKTQAKSAQKPQKRQNSKTVYQDKSVLVKKTSSGIVIYSK